MTPDGIRRDTFADYHAGKTRQYIDRTMASGADIFHVLQACIIISWYFYSEGRWVEVWIFAGFQTRVAVPLRLNHPGTFTTHGSGSPGAYLAPPKDQKDLEVYEARSVDYITRLIMIIDAAKDLVDVNNLRPYCVRWRLATRH